MLADLKDLERLRNTPPAQRCPRTSLKPESKQTANKKSELNSAKIRSDIMKIQQMFQAADNNPRTPVKLEKRTDRKNDSEKQERKSGTEINKTRLLAQKLLEASRGNRETLKDRCNNPKNVPPSKGREAKELNDKGSNRSQRTGVDSKHLVKEKDPEEARPRPPVRRRKETRNGVSREVNGTSDDVNKNGGRESSKNNAEVDEVDGSSANEKHADIVNEDAKSKPRELDRPDILDGLLKESDKQLADLRSDLHERGRSRSHWRGFVQSMRLHDVELHSDNEDQKKGKRHERTTYCPSHSGNGRS